MTNIKRERKPATKLIKLDEKKRQAVDLTTRKLKNAIDFGWKEGIAAAVVYCLPESRGWCCCLPQSFLFDFLVVNIEYYLLSTAQEATRSTDMHRWHVL